MGIEPFLIASVVRVVIGQRLVRRLIVEDCVKYKPEDTELAQVARVFGLKNTKDWDGVISMATDAAEEMKKEFSGKIEFYRPKPDLAKEKTGYKGRMGIYEVLANSTDIQNMIVKNATSDEIQEKAITGGMITMQLDGLIKALLGMTSIEEILRVTRE
jgi:type IV pilus assembly protein PilB